MCLQRRAYEKQTASGWAAGGWRGVAPRLTSSPRLHLTSLSIRFGNVRSTLTGRPTASVPSDDVDDAPCVAGPLPGHCRQPVAKSNRNSILYPASTHAVFSNVAIKVTPRLTPSSTLLPSPLSLSLVFCRVTLSAEWDNRVSQ